MSYYVHRNGTTLGPYSPDHVVTMLRAHQLAVEDLATEEGCEDWQPLGNIVDPALLSPDDGNVGLEAFAEGLRSEWKQRGGCENDSPVRSGRIVKKSEFIGAGALVQLVGLACLLLVGVSPVAAIVLCILFFVIGSRMAVKWTCSNCGTKLANRKLRVCPGCQSDLR